MAYLEMFSSCFQTQIEDGDRAGHRMGGLARWAMGWGHGKCAITGVVRNGLNVHVS